MRKWLSTDILITRGKFIAFLVAATLANGLAGEVWRRVAELRAVPHGCVAAGRARDQIEVAPGVLITGRMIICLKG